MFQLSIAFKVRGRLGGPHHHPRPVANSFEVVSLLLNVITALLAVVTALL